MMPSALNMPEPPALKPNIAITSRVPASAPNSGRDISIRKGLTARTRSSLSTAGACFMACEFMKSNQSNRGWQFKAGAKTRQRPWLSRGDRSAVLPRVFFNLANVVLGHKAGAGANVARTVGRCQAIFGKAGGGLLVGLDGGRHLGQVSGVERLHRRQHGDRNVALQVRLLVNPELHRTILDALGDFIRQVKRGHPHLALLAALFQRLQGGVG